MKEMHGMRLQGLTVMHQPTNFFSSRGQFLHPNQLIHRLGRRQMMADRANTAQPLHDYRHFPIGPTLDEFLKATKFDNVQARLMDTMVPIR